MNGKEQFLRVGTKMKTVMMRGKKKIVCKVLLGVAWLEDQSTMLFHACR